MSSLPIEELHYTVFSSTTKNSLVVACQFRTYLPGSVLSFQSTRQKIHSTSELGVIPFSAHNIRIGLIHGCCLTRFEK